MASLSLVVKRLLHLVSTKILGNSLTLVTQNDYPKDEPEVFKPQNLSHSDYQHPATVNYQHENGSFVVMGLQNHDFIKEYLAFVRLGRRDPSIEYLDGIEIYAYSNDRPTTQVDGSIDEQALINTSTSFKWYKDSNEAITDFKSRIELFGGNISQIKVHSNFPDLKAKLEKALSNYQLGLEVAIQNIKKDDS